MDVNGFLGGRELLLVVVCLVVWSLLVGATLSFSHDDNVDCLV